MFCTAAEEVLLGEKLPTEQNREKNNEEVVKIEISRRVPAYHKGPHWSVWKKFEPPAADAL
jgi:hypothetical protein